MSKAQQAANKSKKQDADTLKVYLKQHIKKTGYR